MPESEQLALAPEKLESPLANLVETPLEVAAFLGRDRHEADTPPEMLEGVRGDQTDRGADQAGDLSVVTTRVGGAGLGISLGMARHHERVELAEQREGRPRPCATRDVGAHAGHRQTRAWSKPELAELRFDER